MLELEQRGLETRSEAVYLDGVTDDGRAGFIVRLCRYPHAGFAWAWGHVFMDGQTYAFTNHELSCEPEETDPGLDPTRYVLTWPGGETRFTRTGTSQSPRSAELSSTFRAHAARHAPHGDGAHSCGVEARFRASADAVSNRSGRSEVLGTTTFTLSIGKTRFEFNGRGQYHEQIQSDPRFTSPFSYLTLRGPDLGLIAIRGPLGARGHLLRTNGLTEIGRIELTPPGSMRTFVLHGRDGVPIRGRLETKCDYSIPVFDTYRPGTLVAGDIGGVPVSGCVNDFLLDQLRFDRVTGEGTAEETSS
jgi:hypothetical protein